MLYSDVSPPKLYFIKNSKKEKKIPVHETHLESK